MAITEVATVTLLSGLTPSSGDCAILTEPGREGTFAFSAANLSAQVTADTAHGIYVAPSSDTTGASGAWARGVSGHVNVKWFGAKGDAVVSLTGSLGSITSTTTDDTSAIQAAIDYLDSLGGGTLYFPKSAYYVSSYLTLRKNLRILGAGRKASVICANMTGGGGANAAENLRNGSVFWGNFDGASSNPVHITVEHMGFLNPNTSSWRFATTPSLSPAAGSRSPERTTRARDLGSAATPAIPRPANW